MKNIKRFLTSIKQSIMSMFKRLFRIGSKHYDLSKFEKAEIKTPIQLILSNFFHNKFAIIGMIGFISIFSFSFIGSAMNPLDQLYIEPILKNLPPGQNYLDVDINLEKEGVIDIRSGVSFSVGLSKQGNLFFWGNNQADTNKLPSALQGEKFKKIAVGDRHVLALSTDGIVYGWGDNFFQQDKIPIEIQELVMIDPIVDLFASDSYSGCLTQRGNVYFWGNTDTSSVDRIPEGVQSHVKKVAASPYNTLMLLDDGRVITTGVEGNEFFEVPEKIKNGEVKAVDIAVTIRNAAIIDENGELHVWGTRQHHLLNPPKINDPLVSIEAGRNSFSVLDENGKVYAWGDNTLNDTSLPNNLKDKKVIAIYSDYFQSYAVDEDGNIDAWGNKGYIVGSDEQGRDVLTRLMAGGKVTLVVGIIAVVIASFIGLFVGLLSGFKGGWIDHILMRFTDIIMSIPFMPLVITLSALIGNSMDTNQKMYLVMAILGLLSWPSIARLVRAQILIEREKDFVLAARAMGIKESSIIIRHIMPNVINITIVYITLMYATTMLMEAGLSFLGFGVQAPIPTWGNMLNGAQESIVIQFYWWRWILPALCVLIAALSVNLIGDALRDALDPKANEK